MIVAVQLKYVKDVVESLNKAFPPSPVGIPSQKYVDRQSVQFNAKEDPYFSAHYTSAAEGRWWLVCCNYWIWQDSYEYMRAFCDALSNEHGINCSPCQMHVVGVKGVKDMVKEPNTTIKYFIGKISWG